MSAQGRSNNVIQWLYQKKKKKKKAETKKDNYSTYMDRTSLIALKIYNI